MEHLHEEDFEILLPDKIPVSHEQPFILSIGPSFTMVIPILLMALVGSKIYGSNSSFIYMTLITGGTGALLACFWGITNHIYRRYNRNQQLIERDEEFDRYLESVDAYLNGCYEDNREFMNLSYPYVITELGHVSEGYLFKRYRLAKDYMFIRLGIGEVRFQMNIKVKEDRNEMFMSKEAKKAYEIKEKFEIIKNVPIGIDLSQDRIIGISLPTDDIKTYELMTNILIDVAYSHNPDELKILLLYDASNKFQFSLAQSVRSLPHFWIEGGAIRLIAGCESDVNYLLPYLKGGINDDASVVIFILSDIYIAEETFYQRILREEADEYVFILKDRDLLPNNVKRVIDEKEAIGYEVTRFAMAAAFGRELMSMRGYEKVRSKDIPDSVDFLNLFDARRISEVNVRGLWNKNLPGERLKCPIGRTYGGRKMYLDIHEKYHGPHGLIAGTTGAGKSELIQTYVMSLCFSYSPNEVNFFLIDYKGGGTGNYISELPHCAGTISNLSGNQIVRAMKAVKSENMRRQRLLARYGVNHIDRYQELYRNNQVSEPMPHLVIIIDEFAELKKEEPDFMSNIISLAAVGRSLGIHLILATQKPAGVVDDKIWSNSNFKLCLRVQDKQDSMDMLHRPEASRLIRPGQCYIQVGNDEYFEQFQTGYCGGNYVESKVDIPDVRMVLDTGERYALPDEEQREDTLKLMKLVDYVCGEAKKDGLSQAKRLWIPELADEVSLEDCIGLRKEAVSRNASNLEKSSMVLGIYDDPANQDKGLAVYAPDQDGHLCIIGGPATGKSKALMALAWQIDGEDEMLLMDVSQNEIMTYASYSNCMGYLNRVEDIDIFFYHLHKEYMRRKKLDVISRRLYVIADNFGNLWKKLTENEQEFLAKLISEGISLKVFFIITGSLITDVPQKLLAKFRTTMALEMNDRYAYGDIMRQYHLDVSPKPGIPGRALYKVDGRILECQVAKTDEELSSKDILRYKSRRFPKIPETVTLDSFLEEIEGTDNQKSDIIPLGYSLKSGYVRGIEERPGGAAIILGQENSGRHELLKNIEMTLVSYNEINCDDVVEVLDKPDLVEVANGRVADIYLDTTRIVLINNIPMLLRSAVRNESALKLVEYMENCITAGTGPMFIGVVNPVADQDVLNNHLIRVMKDKGCGICLGGNLNSQRLFEFNDVSFNEASMKQKKGIGYVGGRQFAKTMRLLIPSDVMEEEENDYD